MGYGQPVVI